MKAFICILILALSGAVAAKADTITVTFDQPNQTAGPGGTLQFFGTITNNTNTTVFLDFDDPNFHASDMAVDDLFFANVPPTLAPGASTGDIELFDVAIASPFPDAFTTYLGEYTISGGADVNAQDNLTTADFSVTVVPEPSSIYLMLTGFSTLLPIAGKIRKQAA